MESESARRCFVRWMVIALAVLIALSGVAAGPVEATPSRKVPAPGQCWLQSPSGKVRLWWDEGDARHRLGGSTSGQSAADGRCDTVPASVPWIAGQFDDLVGALANVGLPGAKSDKGIQRIDQAQSDHGSGALDVYLDGEETDYADAATNCVGVSYYQAGRWRYRTYARMDMQSIPADVPDAARAQRLRLALAHELVHSAQCAVTSARQRTAGSWLPGEWTEAVPQAIALGLTGGNWQIGQCDDTSRPLSSEYNMDAGYGQWPFWYELLGPDPGRRYQKVLRDLVRYPPTKMRGQLERRLREHFTDAQIGHALLFWLTRAYLGGTMTARDGTPITWPLRDLKDSYANTVDETTFEITGTQYRKPLQGRLDPTAGAGSSLTVTVPPTGCAALLVSFPGDAQTVRIGATGTAVRDLSTVMAVGVDTPPGSTPTTPCWTDGPRTVIPLSDGTFTVPRTCTPRDASAPIWLLMANGRQTPLQLTVTATSIP